MTEFVVGRYGLGKALPASILLHMLAAAFAVFATVQWQAAAPPVIDLTLVGPTGTEDGPIPARERARRPMAAASQAAAALSAPSPHRDPPAVPQEPRLSPPAPAAGIPAPTGPVAGSTGLPPAFLAPEGSRIAASTAAEPPGPARVASGVSSPAGKVLPGTKDSGVGGIPIGTDRAIETGRGYGYLRDTIQRGIAYPTVARKMGWEGDVVVSFRIHPDGSASDIRVVRGSGIAVLDRNAVEAVRTASPFQPAPPAEAEIVTPVVYRLNRERSP